MKNLINYLLSIIVISLFLSCSKEDQLSVPVSDLQEASLKTLRAKEIVSDAKFQDYMMRTFQQIGSDKARENNGKGIIFMDSGSGFFGFGTGSGFIFFISNDEVPTLKIFPDGTGSITLNSNDVSSFWFDISNPISFGNFCDEEPKGKLNVSFKGFLEVDEGPFGKSYFVRDPFENAYTFKASNVKLSNETTTFDEETQTETCNDDATEERTVNLTIVDNGNNRYVNFNVR
ncbi:hypothetical protein [Christiangramia sabulilitoris]|uniref:Lipoprotein n=1 Tax=Christiangramia sabulilitoris TaxID=2583991 RepID=A0A550I6N6_9FLAO|nr:hypothetical protein [Christiangramia sabulilitoris]TRO66640.1 hypothetical protein FGM01_01785 [Christiangramia sabulilitoris]